MANIKDALLQAYTILEFAPQEIDEAISNIITQQQAAAIEVLMADMTQEEIVSLNVKSTQGPEEERIKEVEGLLLKRSANDGFNAKVAAAMSEAIAEHIEQLKTMGDKFQRMRLEKVFWDIIRPAA